MVDLTDISGIPMKLDLIGCKLVFEDCVECFNKQEISLADINPILLNKFIRYPENVYTHHQNVKDKNRLLELPSKLKYDLVVVPYSLLGIEYNRTHIFKSTQQKNKFSCFIEVLHGEITVIAQKNKEDNDPYSYNTYVEEVDIIRLKSGDKITIPAGVFFSFVNTGQTHSVFGIISTTSLKEIDYALLKKEKGLAFYIISKNSRMEIVANPKYKVDERPKQKLLRNMEEHRRNRYLNNLLFESKRLYDTLSNQQAAFAEALA